MVSALLTDEIVSFTLADAIVSAALAYAIVSCIAYVLLYAMPNSVRLGLRKRQNFHGG